MSCWGGVRLFFSGLAILPFCVAILSYITFMTSYTISIAENHTYPLFPYISDTGTKSPESCVFGQLTNFIAFFALCCMFVRYKQLYEHVDTHLDEATKISRLNAAALVIGCFSSLGISMVANFQETNVEPVHFLGAAFAFGGGMIYMILNTIISCYMRPQTTRLECMQRLCITAFGITILALSMISAFVAAYQWRAGEGPNRMGAHRFFWRPADPGYTAHVVSTFGEWGMAFSFMFFFLTYIPDFRMIVFKAVVQPHSPSILRGDFDPLTEESPLLSA